MELRLRVEYHEVSEVISVATYLASPGDSLPASASLRETSGAVLHLVEANVDFVRGAVARGGSFAVLGSLRKELVPWLGSRMAADAPITIQFQLALDSSDRIEHLTVSWPGGAATAVNGKLVSLSTLRRTPTDAAQGRSISTAAMCAPLPRRHVDMQP